MAQSSFVNKYPEIIDLVYKCDELSRQIGRLLLNNYKTEQYAIYKKLNQEIIGSKQ